MKKDDKEDKKKSEENKTNNALELDRFLNGNMIEKVWSKKGENGSNVNRDLR